MTKPKAILTDSAKATEIDRGQIMHKADVPFFRGDGDDYVEVPCVHSQMVTAYTDEADGKTVGVLAMARDGRGLFAAYKADEIRSLASQLLLMANHIDEENADG